MSVKLEVNKLDYKYDNLKVLKEISFAITEGSFIGLIGPNGSGKSTLLKNINALLKPDSGTVYLDNFDLEQMKPKEIAKELAVVPQNTNISFDFTVEEIVLMGRSPYLNRFKGESKKDLEIAKQAMLETNILELKDRLFSQLSGGEKQRVIIARSLAQEPTVLLLDEPTSNLDINYQLEIMNLLTRLNLQEDLTILTVLHDLNLAAQYCEKLILLKGGEIYDYGSPAEIITSENIEEVYGSKVVINRDYEDGKPYIRIPKQKGYRQEELAHQIHLISGGGTGRRLIENLVRSGYQLSCGVLNQGDSDWDAAYRLGVEVVTEKPFAPISTEKHEENLALIKAADTIILTDTPIGHGNLLNLKATLWAAKNGKEIIVVGEDDLSQRDYTNGESIKLFEQLLAEDVIVVEKEDVLEQI